MPSSSQAPAPAPAHSLAGAGAPAPEAAALRRGKFARSLAVALFVVVALGLVSTLVGGARMSPVAILTGQASPDDLQILLASRIPRTLAVILAGAAMAVAGLVMQLLVRNRFVEPSSTGVTESAGLGILVATIFIPTLSLPGKMAIAVAFALAGTALLTAILRSLDHRDIVVVPLVGLILSGVIGAATLFLAWEFQLQGTLNAWMTGDFSGIIRGRYELLWIVAAAALLAYLFADRFTVAGLGEDLARNLGLNYGAVQALGLTIVALVTGITTVVAGPLPFLGLVVPNLVSIFHGDYIRRSLPLVALVGAAFVLVADLLSRTLIAPAEVPVGVVMGVVGAAIFLTILLKRVR
ncbi:ABC transporter permease [Trueperella pecoris]|uniref:ABC transporter permease n=1 Tax=Trueperella pecoris TaxID=2733571 RepID=UPI001ABEB1BC|nr:iron chelate uptake ABC transporter family permease subunit [Trueperella pecoris]QTG75616.1 iron chelate uptake ABC transporter family permease subunit [Trueperella pecoris]